MARIQLSQRMYSVGDVDRLLKSGEMQIQPKYQRRRTPWPLSAKTALIDTVLNNYPIPPIYLRDFVDDAKKRQKEIIDGQQRISTIVEYYNLQFALAKNLSDKTLSGCTYLQLSETERLAIEDYEIPFVSIRGATETDVISIFNRLNSFSLPLNAQELRNSKFAGAIKTLIYQIASDYNKFWIVSGVLSESQIARMADALLVSEIVCTMLSGMNSTQNAVLNTMYAQYDESFPDRDRINDEFNNVMPIMWDLFSSSQIKNTFNAKYMFFTLFIVIYDNIYGLGNKTNRIKINFGQTKKKLEGFSIKYSRGDFDPDFMRNFKQATNNVGQRKMRHTEVSKLVV